MVASAMTSDATNRMDPDSFGDAVANETLPIGFTIETGKVAGNMAVAFRAANGAVVSISTWSGGTVTVSGNREDIPWEVLGVQGDLIYALPCTSLEVDGRGYRHPYLTDERAAKLEAERIAASIAAHNAWVAGINASRIAAGQPALVGDLYLAEEICGGADAAGHGCGAPLGTYQVPKARFEIMKGVTENDFIEINDSEAQPEWIRARDEGTLFVKAVYRPCMSCRQP
jgi:hypothetical protein